MEASGETISYRPVSKLAVAAAVLGLLSSLSITTPLLWVLPLAGTVESAACADPWNSARRPAIHVSMQCLFISISMGCFRFAHHLAGSGLGVWSISVVSTGAVLPGII